MMPLWMFALGRYFVADLPGYEITVPYKNICYSLLMLVVPLCVGVLLRRFLPKLASCLNPVLKFIE